MTKTRILIADDDRVILTTLAESLADFGYEVLTAANGKEAVALCRQERPDLAILDVRMPEMTGIEAARHIRADPETPVVFLSAYGDSDVVRQAVEEGALGYLVKPVDTSQIVPTIEAALARGQELKEFKEAKAHLSRALEAGRETNVAIGLIMERYRLSVDGAFDVLRALARSQSREVSELARTLLQAGESLNLLQTVRPKEGHGRKPQKS